jgi:hypothetical protein
MGRMIVPDFWAEGRVQQQVRSRQVTVRRFGWSDTSQADAQAAADARAAEAMARVVAGEDVRRRDHKRSYNGAEGLPIREEVLERHGNAVITRNVYGARCINVPDVLFADIDFETARPALPSVLRVVAVVVAAAIGGYVAAWIGAAIGAVAAFAIASMFVRSTAAAGGKEAAAEIAARARIDRFVAAHPDWNLALYRTPAGFRLLALHRRFDPNEAAVKACFTALGVDRIYARMCENQHCFRARLSAKPWRIGMTGHLKPRPGIWPIRAEELPRRIEWVAEYERRAAAYAACRFVAQLGKGRIDHDADRIRVLHDRMSRATEDLPLA